MLLFIFCFFLVFCFQIHNIFVSNIVFVAYFLHSLATKKVRIKNGKDNLFLVLFLLCILFSTVWFNSSRGSFSLQDITTLVFSLQYSLLLLFIDIETEKFERYFLLCTYLFSLYIVFLFFQTGTFLSTASLLSDHRMWGEAYIPGWPNTTGLSLLVGLFFSFRKKTKLVFRFLLIAALFLTTSRVAILGAAIIVCYFLVFGSDQKSIHPGKKGVRLAIIVGDFLVFRSEKKSIHPGKKGVRLAIIVAAAVFLSVLVLSNESLRHRLFVSYDRINILQYSITVIRLSPFFGFGGHSIDYTFENVGHFGALMNWGHSHNTVLEIGIRYGLFALLFFLTFLFMKFKTIKNRDFRFLFVFLLFISLFQIYIRNFNFVFFLMFCSNCLGSRKRFFDYVDSRLFVIKRALH